MHDIDLNLLYTLRCFVEQGSLAAAARELSRSEPAISARLHRLEEELGVELFERVGRRLTLTPAGREVNAEAVAIIDRAQRVVDVARRANATISGRLRVGTLGTVGVYLLGPLVAELVTEYDDLTVEMVQGTSVDLTQGVSAGELDVVVCIGARPDDPDVEVETLREIRPVVVSHGLERQSFDADKLRDHRLLEWALADDLFFGRVSRFLRDRELAANVRVQVPHIATLKVLVRQGAGLAILPDYTVVDPDLVAHPLEGLDLVQPLWLAYRKAAADLPVVHVFRDSLTSLNPP